MINFNWPPAQHAQDEDYEAEAAKRPPLEHKRQVVLGQACQLLSLRRPEPVNSRPPGQRVQQQGHPTLSTTTGTLPAAGAIGAPSSSCSYFDLFEIMDCQQASLSAFNHRDNDFWGADFYLPLAAM